MKDDEPVEIRLIGWIESAAQDILRSPYATGTFIIPDAGTGREYRIQIETDPRNFRIRLYEVDPMPTEQEIESAKSGLQNIAGELQP